MWCIRNWLCLAFLRAWLYDNNDEKQHRLSAVSHVIAVLKRSLGTSSNGFWLVTKRDHYFLTLAENTFKNVSFNIASKASYFYILSGQKFIKNAKNGEFKKKTKACGQIVLPDRSFWIGPKIDEKYQKWLIWRVLKTWSLRSNSVTRQVNLHYIWVDIYQKCQN